MKNAIGNKLKLKNQSGVKEEEKTPEVKDLDEIDELFHVSNEKNDRTMGFSELYQNL